jgi:hypothetical protein
MIWRGTHTSEDPVFFSDEESGLPTVAQGFSYSAPFILPPSTCSLTTLTLPVAAVFLHHPVIEHWTF